MARRGGGVRIPAVLDADGVKSGVKDAEKALDKLNKSSSRAFSATKIAAGGAALAIGGGLVAALKDGFEGLQDAQKATAQLEATLKSTGNTTGWTKKEMMEWADVMEQSTGIAAETTMQAESLLATFSNIGRDSFPAATRAAIDMSVAFDQSAKSSAIQLGKALQDPIKGVSALQRIGVSFTDQQKEQIKTLVEGNKVQEAQAIILGEVNKQVADSAHAWGNTLQGRLAKAQHAWGAITEELAARLLPVMVDLLDWVNRNMPTIQRVMMKVADGISGAVKFVRAVIEQDWATANKLLVKAAKIAWDAVVALIKAATPWLARAAEDAGKAIARGLWNGFERGLLQFRGTGALRRFLGMSSGDIPQARIDEVIASGAGGVNQYRRAGGGYVPGPPGAGDVVPAMLTPGEVVLNTRQQRLLGYDAIREVLARTGGVIGGNRFASGGYVDAARQRAVSNLGEPYGKPSRGESRTGPGSWDCSGYATMIAGVNVGGTTSSAYQQSTAVSDPSRYPIVWGFRKSHSGGYRGGYDEHMGVRVGGVWYQTSGGRTAQTGSDGDWQELRVPNGLANLSDADAGGTRDASTERPAGISRGTARKLARSLMRGGRATGPGLSDVPASIAARHRDDALQQRRLEAAGAPQSQLLTVQKREYEADVRDLSKAITARVKRKNILLARRRKLRAELIRKGTTPPRRLKIVETLRVINDALTEVNDAIRSLAAERIDVRQQAAILGFDIQDAVAEENATAPDAEATAAEDPLATAQLEQATATAASATVNARASEDFIRAAFGVGDIGAGGANAAAAAGIVIQSLTPDGPETLRRIQEAMAMAVGASAFTTTSTLPSGA